MYCQSDRLHSNCCDEMSDRLIDGHACICNYLVVVGYLLVFKTL